MVQTIQAKDITLRDLVTQFGIQLVRDEQFFREWQDDLPEITDSEKQLLDRVQAGYFNLLNYPPLLEDAIKLAVLSPVLYLAGFYLFPFHIRSEQSIQITEEDEGVIITGKIDVLVLKEQLWVMVIESKKASFSIEAGLAQILAYMLAQPNPEKPSFGMITTGGSFVFIKLVKEQIPRYATSRVFELLNPGNDLYSVLSILKRLSQIVTSN
jgi:hypothetical protein